MKNINKTFLGVAIFLAVLMLGAFSEFARAEAFVGLGRSILNSGTTVGQIGYRFDGKYEIHVSAVGQGSTKNGPQRQTYSIGAYRLFDTAWYLGGLHVRPGIGVAYTPNNELIGETNFRLGLSFEYYIFSLNIFHDSSAGIHDPNTGHDYGMYRLFL